MYAPGVAETILEDAFSSNSLPNSTFQASLTRQFLPASFTPTTIESGTTETGPVGWVDWIIGRRGTIRLEDDV